MQIVLATNNEDKIREIKNLLDDLPITILSRDDFLEFPDIEETGTTLKENALLKASGIAKFCELPALADDTGLEVDALDGAPGVYSSRFAGENVSYRDNYEKLIADLKDVPTEKRTARFRTVIAIDWQNGERETVEGIAEGLITKDVSGEQGFGYDPIFYHTKSKKRFSEMTVEEKNLVSHRGLALQKIRDIIIERINKFRQ
ncbi:MAG: non-canonical purine NTP pyrophosphatase, RdgB/HAM1 family [Candidatus Zixiibacteriota bacterium]|nr:MAG: non-canonical purine NTP pyrophosphatase, RdgB/HAM1 family [candidate division Zixibacteria bacterium]